MFKSAEDKNRNAEKDSRKGSFFAVSAYCHIHKNSAEESADKSLKSFLRKFCFANNFCRFTKSGVCEADGEAEKNGRNNVAKKSAKKNFNGFLAVVFRKIANLSGKKGISFKANAKERNGKKNCADVSVFTGKENASADGDHNSGFNAVDDKFQHMVIFSSDSSIVPMM